MSAEFECGQILFNLKKSNLHYLIEETHKSAYITIRKKLISDITNPPREVISDYIVDNSKSIDQKVRLENGLLKQEINDLKKTIANLEVDKDESDMKNESLNETIDALDDKLEIAYSESRTLRDNLNRMEVEINDNCEKLKQKDTDINNLQANIVKLNVSKDRLEMLQNQHEENVLMLENVIETEHGKVRELEKDIMQKRSCDKCENVSECNGELLTHNETPYKKEDVSSTSKCGTCDYASESANDVNAQNQIKHAFSCEVCGIIFKNKVKLQTHMCRIIVKNPTCGDYYTKNWVIAKTCTRVFSSSEKKEVLFLHSEQCIDQSKSCQDLNSDYSLPNYYGNTFHAPIDDYFTNGLMNWESLHGQFDINIE